MHSAPDLTVLVNTSDGFEDCWAPFFTLFARHWPDCPYPVVLNTEHRTFEVSGIAVRCARSAAGTSRRLTWSECLARCLDTIETPFVLYLQEDYFLDAPVRAEYIETFLAEMRAGRADVIRLMECGGSGPWHPSGHPLLWTVDAQARYRIALQAALWRRSTLRRHLRRHENAWQLEVFGSARARGDDDCVLCVDRERFHGPGREIVPYTPTGIVKGRWERRIVEPLFAAHGIEVDFERRGFHDPSAPVRRAPLALRMVDRLRSLI